MLSYLSIDISGIVLDQKTFKQITIKILKLLYVDFTLSSEWEQSKAFGSLITVLAVPIPNILNTIVKDERLVPFTYSFLIKFVTS